MKWEVIYIICLNLLHTCVYCQENNQLQKFITQDQDTIQISIESENALFGPDDPLQITLTFDIQGFQRTKSKEEYHDAVISIKFNEKDSITQDIRIKARGFMRLRYCDFPPIMLNLKGVDFPIDGIPNQKKLKLVTYCKKSPVFETYVLKEYLVYKLYNLLTPYSLGARLVQVKYIDINKPDKAYTAYGFLIEDLDKMAERNNSIVVEFLNIKQTDMIPIYMARTAIFQYMIGNTDWAVMSQHNIKVLKSLDMITAQTIPVPYDFDFSGFVETPYAAPAPALPIKYVTERYYMGMCVPDEDLIKVLDEFKELEVQFLETINNFEFVSASSRKKASKYIESFYKLYKNQNTLINTFKNSCAGNENKH